MNEYTGSNITCSTEQLTGLKGVKVEGSENGEFSDVTWRDEVKWSEVT
jgi:hypothetical protein